MNKAISSVELQQVGEKIRNNQTWRDRIWEQFWKQGQILIIRGDIPSAGNSRENTHTHTHFYAHLFGFVSCGRGRVQLRHYWGVTAAQAPQPPSPLLVPMPMSTSTLTAVSMTGGSTSLTLLSQVGASLFCCYFTFLFVCLFKLISFLWEVVI